MFIFITNMINAINPNFNTNYKTKCNYTAKRKTSSISFKAHPDFLKLSQHYELKASSFFRRGAFYGSPSDHYQDIVNVFRQIFSPDSVAPKKMLIAGIGDSQETFSHLATIKDIKKNKPIKDVVDLYTIDLQSKPEPERIHECSFFEHPWEPNYAADSFVTENKKYRYGTYPYYRVNDEILNFTQNTYANPKKSQWERSLQEALPEFEPESFDIISINNTLGYIKEDDVRHGVLRNVVKLLKKGGIFITDPFYEPRMKKAGVADAFKEIKEGIYQKII